MTGTGPRRTSRLWPAAGRAGWSAQCYRAWRSPCSAYSASRSLSEMPRRPASAASRSARSSGRTMVRCTLSSLSQPSSLNSGKLPPLRYQRTGAFDRDIAAEDTVAQQAEAAEVRKPRPLREPRHDRQVQRRRQAGYGQVDIDHALQFAAAQRVPVPGARVLTQEGLEPAPIEADGHDNGVIRDALALIAVGDGHNHVVLARLDPGRPPSESVQAARLVEHRLSLQREDATIGAHQELTPVCLGQARPLPGVGVEAVLVVALTARVQDAASGQHVDRRVLVATLHQIDDHRRGSLATADDAGVQRALMFKLVRRQPVGPPVQDPGVITRLAGHGDDRPGPGDHQAIGGYRSARLEPDVPAATAGNLQAGHDTADNFGLRRFGDFAQVCAPLAMSRAHPAAVDPVAVGAVPDQVALPAVPRHRRDHIS